MENRIQLAAIRGNVTETTRKAPTAFIMSVRPFPRVYRNDF